MGATNFERIVPSGVSFSTKKLFTQIPIAIEAKDEAIEKNVVDSVLNIEMILTSLSRTPKTFTLRSAYACVIVAPRNVSVDAG